MTSHARLKNLQDTMTTLFDQQQPASPEDLAQWMSELDLAMADASLASASFRRISDVSHSLNLLSRIFCQADTSGIRADEIGTLMAIMQARVEITLERVQDAYL